MRSRSRKVKAGIGKTARKIRVVPFGSTLNPATLALEVLGQAALNVAAETDAIAAAETARIREGERVAAMTRAAFSVAPVAIGAPAALGALAGNISLREPCLTTSFFALAWRPWDIAKSAAMAASAAAVAAGTMTAANAKTAAETAAAAALTADERQKLLAFIELRVKHTFGELVHDFSRRFFEIIFDTPARRTAVIKKLYAYVPDALMNDAAKNAAATALNGGAFYNACTTDAAAKKEVVKVIDIYLRQYENISTIYSFGTEPYSVDENEDEFFGVIRDTYDIVGGRGGNMAAYLDAWASNLLADYYKFRGKLDGQNIFCCDLAYEFDPGSGWNPPDRMYTTMRDYRDQIFPAICTGLGRDLQLHGVYEGGQLSYISATWDGGYTIRTYARSNSVTAMSELMQQIVEYSTLPPGADKVAQTAILRRYSVLDDVLPLMAAWPVGDNRFYDLLIDIMLIKTAGDRNQNYSINSVLWSGLGPNNPVGVSNDLLCILDFIFYKGRSMIQSGQGYYKLFRPGALADATITDDDLKVVAQSVRGYVNAQPGVAAIAPLIAALEAAIMAFNPAAAAAGTRDTLLTAVAAILGLTLGGRQIALLYCENIMNTVQNRAIEYFIYTNTLLRGGSIPRFTKQPIAAVPAALPPNTIISENTIYSTVPTVRIEIENGISLSGDGSTFIVGNAMKANKLIAGALTYIIDTLEKYTVLETIIDKNDPASFAGNLVNDIQIAAGAHSTLSAKYKSLVAAPNNNFINMYKYFDLYSIYTQKASYNKIATSISPIENDMVYTVGGGIDSAIPLFLIFHEIVNLLKAHVTRDLDNGTVNFYAYVFTFLIYDLTCPNTPNNARPGPIPPEGESPRDARLRSLWNEIDKRRTWLSGTSNVPVVKTALLGLFGYNLRGELRITEVDTEQFPGIPLGDYRVLNRNLINKETTVRYGLPLFGAPASLDDAYRLMNVNGTIFGYDTIKRTVDLSAFTDFLQNIIKTILGNVSVARYEPPAVTYGGYVDITAAALHNYAKHVEDAEEDAAKFLAAKNADALRKAEEKRNESIKGKSLGEKIGRVRLLQKRTSAGSINERILKKAIEVVGRERPGEIEAKVMSRMGRRQGGGADPSEEESVVDEGESMTEYNPFLIDVESIITLYYKVINSDSATLGEFATVLSNIIGLAACVDNYESRNGFDVLRKTAEFYEALTELPEDPDEAGKYLIEITYTYVTSVPCDLTSVAGLLSYLFIIAFGGIPNNQRAVLGGRVPAVNLHVGATPTEVEEYIKRKENEIAVGGLSLADISTKRANIKAAKEISGTAPPSIPRSPSKESVGYGQIATLGTLVAQSPSTTVPEGAVLVTTGRTASGRRGGAYHRKTRSRRRNKKTRRHADRGRAAANRKRTIRRRS